jgi:uncharacterized membrane protein YkvA (DUF1232 family)
VAHVDASADVPRALPAWALVAAARPDAQARVESRLGRVLARVRDASFVARVKELYGYTRDPRVPARYKLVVLAGLVYLVNPFDAIPDALPGVGFLDDAAVVLAVLEGVRRIVDSVEASAKRVVTHAVAETEEAFARRGVQQIALLLWTVTVAACVALVYAAARSIVLPDGSTAIDPFAIALAVTGAVGLVTSLALARRVWAAYRAAPVTLAEPLAAAVLSVLGVREIVLLSLPIVALLLLIALKLGLAFGH